MKITDAYTACAIIEGFCDCEHTALDEYKAWAYLIANGDVWHLQGFYGRNATQLIENGLVTKTGQVTAKTRTALGLA